MAEKKLRSISIREFIDSTGRMRYDVIVKENDKIVFSKDYVQRLSALDKVYDSIQIEGE